MEFTFMTEIIEQAFVTVEASTYEEALYTAENCFILSDYEQGKIDISRPLTLCPECECYSLDFKDVMCKDCDKQLGFEDE